MDRDPPPPPQRATSSFPFAGAGGTTPRSPMVRGATSSPMLTSLSSSSAASARSHHRYYSSLYPPPLPAARLGTASTTAAGGYSYGGSSSSRFQFRRQQIPAPPPLARAEPERPGRPRTTCALPTPFFSELAEIRRIGASLFGDLDAPTRRGAAPAIYGRGQHRDRQPWTPLSFTPPARGRSFSGFTPPPPSAGMPPPPPSRRFSAGYYSSPSPSAAPAGIFSGTPSWPLSSSTSLPPPPVSLSRQQQPLSSTGMLPPLPTPRFSGAGGILSDPSPSWASQQQQAPAPQQQLPVTASSFTDLAPLPEGYGFSGFTPSHTNETTNMFGSSSWSPADMAATAAASARDTMHYGQAQPSPSSDSELPPLPPSLQMQPEDLNQAPSFWQQPSAGNNSCYGTETATDQSEEETRLQAPMTDLLQVKQEPGFDESPCQLDPVYVALDDDEEKFLSALLHSFKSPSESESLDNQAPLSSDGWLQTGGLGDVEGSGQSWDMEAMMNTPLSSLFNNMVNAGSSGASGSGIPMNCDGYSVPMSQQQQQQQIPPPQEGDQQFSMGFSADWQLSQNDLQIPLLPSSTDSLQLMNNSSQQSPSIWNTGGADGSGQGCSDADADISGQAWAGLPALANMFHQMNIIGQAGTATPEAGGQDGMLDFDSSGNSNGAWASMPSFANNLDQMNTGGGDMSIGQGFSATPAPMFDINGSGSMQLNFSSSTMESSTPEPKLMLGGMERPRMPRCTPSLTAGASSSGMPQRGAYGDFFSEADMATINKDKRLKQMVNTDPKRVKRILNNRASVAKLKAQRQAEFLDLI
ncbi:unnamed protein product [Urochloa decumbens]|uniref:BZIP domain-containing protein n=1 Tax=Urochloa decumbens TaxID=240449 RepID=A0ABC9FHS5_9POAL